MPRSSVSQPVIHATSHASHIPETKAAAPSAAYASRARSRCTLLALGSGSSGAISMRQSLGHAAAATRRDIARATKMRMPDGRLGYHFAMNPSANPLIRLKIERRSNHPWIFQKMVEKPEPRPKPGTVVDIIDRDGTFAGRGFYNGNSRISLRVLTADPNEHVDDAFFERKIADAVQLRRDVLKLDAVTDAY